MTPPHRHLRPLAIGVLLLAEAGCSGRGAPSLILFGAYFPGWMFCAFLGILASIVTRVIMVTSGRADQLPFPLFVCVSVGLLCSAGVWLMWLDR